MKTGAGAKRDSDPESGVKGRGMEGIMQRLIEMFLMADERGILTVMMLVACVTLIALLWLVFRKYRLWYWKVDLQIDTLMEIDGKLKRLENEIKENVIFMDELLRAEEAPPDGRSTEKADAVFHEGENNRALTEEELEELIKD